RSFIRKLVVPAGLCGLLALAVVVPVGSAARRDTQGFSCSTVGSGMICRDFEVEVVGPREDPNIVCGSGAGAFHIFDQWVDNQTRTLWLDENGDPTRFTEHDVYSFVQWTTPRPSDR